ncbi:MAG: hypothetical protein ACR2N3_07400 [Pyrinomonadaceae bacterium]
MRNLTQNLLNTLEHCTVYETLYLELAAGTILRFATGEVVIGGNTYLGELKITSPLRMSLTKAADNISMEISNVTLALGQALISQPRALDGSFAVVGAYFKNNTTGEEFHDEKICGEIVASQIDGDKILISFLSETDAARYQGDLISEKFPNAELQRQSAAAPVEDFRQGVIDRQDILSRKMSPLTDDFQQDGRYSLPEISLW